MTADALAFEAILRRVLREELALALPRCHPAHDRRLQPFLVAVWAFSGAAPWSAGEILSDARRAGRRALLAAVDEITGDDGDPAIRLGRWLQRQVDVDAGGLRLIRIKREHGSWLYGVELTADSL